MTRSTKGWINGFIGMLIFSGSLPATRLAVAGFDPLFLTAARAVIAAHLAIAALALLRARWPHRSDLLSLAVVALGVVVGFPLLTALALERVTSAHAMVFIGLLPLSTALFGAIRGGERPRPSFWLFAVLGASIVAGYALRFGTATSLTGDALMLASIAICGLGYAEGGKLSRRLGGFPVICWALVMALPVMIPLAILSPGNWSRTWEQATGSSLMGLAYVSVFSMLVGFIFWYRGLAEGGIASVGQLQLLQPFFGLALSALLLHEAVGSDLVIVALAAAGCVALAKHFSRGTTIAAAKSAPAIP